MEIHLSPEKEAQLSQIALNTGRTVDMLVQEIVSCYLKEQARFIDAVKEGIAAADRGEFVKHEEVLAHIEGLLKS